MRGVITYDLKRQPNTFDFAVFLVGAHIFLKRHCIERYTLRIIKDGFRNITEREVLYSNQYKSWRLNKIIIGVARLLPQIDEILVQSQDWTTAQENALYPPPQFERNKLPLHLLHQTKYLSEILCPTQDEWCTFKDSEISKSYIKKSRRKNYITITLRSSVFQRERNSDLKVWAAFANYLIAKDYEVVIIPDFETPLDATLFNGCVIDYLAMLDTEIRLSLYINAFVNYAVSNGPCTLLYFSKAKFSVFKFIVEGVNNATVEYQKAVTGLEKNQKYIWLDHNQRIFWSHEALADLVNDFEDRRQNYLC